MLYIKLPTGQYRPASGLQVCEAAAELIKPAEGQVFRSPEDANQFLVNKMGMLEHEVFAVIYLTNQHKLIQSEELFRGTVDGCSVYPREIAKRVLETNASAVILVHNHPSGNPEPSSNDERLTRRVKSALDLIDVRLLDHIIVAKDRCTSLAARGVI